MRKLYPLALLFRPHLSAGLFSRFTMYKVNNDPDDHGQCDQSFSSDGYTINALASSGSHCDDTDFHGPHAERGHLVDHTAATKLGVVSNEGKMLKVFVYGAVNALMAIPPFFGYAAIIFRDPAFAPYMPALVKLVLFSSVVHQLVFSVMSTLPFAIGQVQDVGLIFLSRMTTDVAIQVLLRGGGGDAVVATAVVATAVATASLGVALVMVGKLKLARFVSYLPMPVVGGYLAFIGLFCLEAGLGFSTGKDIRGINTWGLLLSWRDILLCLPCIVIGVLWSWVSRTYKHFAVLPLSMLAVPAIFFAVLGVSGWNIQDARDYGLVGPVTQPAGLSMSFGLFKWNLVYWSVLPELFPVWLGMVFVVAFSSTLDVAAIEIDMGEPLDTNKELKTVGWSNIISGLTGGFAGSYIFCQTIFSRRAGCNSRLMGSVVMASELATCLATVDPLSYAPLAFFSATLTFIGIDLMVEWLWEIREKLLTYEYLLLLITFVAIQIVGLDMGLMIGIGCSLLVFVISYASDRSNTLERVHKRGRFMRPASHRRLLQLNRDKILCVELRGEVFFGSSQQILEQVTHMLGLDQTPNGKRGSSAAVSAAVAAPGSGDGKVEEDRTPGEAVQLWCSWAWKALWKWANEKAHSTNAGENSGKTCTRSLSSTRSRGRHSRGRSVSLGQYGDCHNSKERSVRSISNISSTSNIYDISVGTGVKSWKFLRPARKAMSFAGDGDHSVPEERLLIFRDLADGKNSKVAERSSIFEGLPRARWYGAAEDEIKREDDSERGHSGLGDEVYVSPHEVKEEEDERPSYIVLDCSKVTNIDASAARGCFFLLQRLTEACGVSIAYAGLTDKMKTLLRIHKAIDCGNVSVFQDFYTALDWCETQLIRSIGPTDEEASGSFWAASHFHTRESLRSSSTPVEQLLRQILDLPETASAIEGIERYCVEEDYTKGGVIFSPGDKVDSFYVVTEGQVLMEKSSGGSSRQQVVLGVGAIFGYVDFHLEEPRGHSALASEDCTLAVFTKPLLDRMFEENPRLLCLLERSVMKHLALELSNLPV